MLRKLHAAGFHLLEVALTLSLAGALAALSFPSLRTLTQAQLLKSETRKFASLLSSLSLEALQRETEIIIELSSTEYLVRRPARQDFGRFAEPVRVQFQSTAARQISFFPSGAATPATVTFSSGEHTCSLTLSLRGRVASECL